MRVEPSWYLVLSALLIFRKRSSTSVDDVNLLKG